MEKEGNLKIKRYQEELPLIRSAVSFNSFITISPFADVTAIQTGDLLYRSFPYLESNRIGETYMLNSKSSRYRINDVFGINLYNTPVAFVCETKNEERYISKHKEIELPRPVPLKTSLDKAIMRRRSHRRFEEVSIPLDRLASILYYGNGINGKLSIPSIDSEFLNPSEVKLHTSSSAGGLYPLNIFLIATRVKGLDFGVYKYIPNENSLLPVIKEKQLSMDEVYSSLQPAKDVINLENAGFIIVITGMLWKLIRKYGNRGLKYMFIESGEIAQNVHLSAQSLGIGTVDIAGYYDGEIEKMVGIDGTSEFVMHTIIGGTI